jgi:hypothetical protein
MKETRIERDIEREEWKRIGMQLLVGTLLVLAGLVVMGIGEAVCRWIENL